MLIRFSRSSGIAVIDIDIIRDRCLVRDSQLDSKVPTESKGIAKVISTNYLVDAALSDQLD